MTAMKKPKTTRDALAMLREAASDEKRAAPGIDDLVKESIMDVESGMGTTVSEKTRQAAERALDAARAGAARVKKVAGDIDDHVHANPWPVIGGVAVSVFLLGYLLGRRRGD